MRPLLLAAGFLSVTHLCGCGSGSSLDASVAVSPTFSSISKNILQPGCVSCHGGSGGYSFDSYSSTMNAVVAGKPSQSPLYTSLTSGAMPRNGTAPSASQIQAISDWITAGAQNN